MVGRFCNPAAELTAYAEKAEGVEDDEEGGSGVGKDEEDGFDVVTDHADDLLVTGCVFTRCYCTASPPA